MRADGAALADWAALAVRAVPRIVALLPAAAAPLPMAALAPVPARAGAGVHTTYLWHMRQPIYRLAESAWTPGRYETAHETITLGYSQNDEFTIFNSDDRVGDYQWYPKDAVQALLALPETGAQVSFAGALMENLFSLADNHWNGGRYPADWYSHYRTVRGWTNSAGRPRLEPVLVAFHHPIAPLGCSLPVQRANRKPSFTPPST